MLRRPSGPHWHPNIATAIVKRAYSREATITVTPTESRTLIGKTVERGMELLHDCRPCVISPPIAVDIEFASRTLAELFAYVPCFKRLDACTIRYQAQSMAEVIRVLQFWADTAIRFAHDSGLQPEDIVKSRIDALSLFIGSRNFQCGPG